MFIFCLFSVILTLQFNPIDSHCHTTPLCQLNQHSMTITCDGTFDNQNESSSFPILTCFPPVTTYLFRNFEQIQSHAFQNLTFPSNQSITIQLINITMIDTEAFSNSLIIPDNSKLIIEIGDLNSASDIIIKSNAFNYINISRLYFSNINNFNGRPVFDTNCFGKELDIDELTFDQCGLTGFSNSIRKAADVNHLSIINCPLLTQLTRTSLPSFLFTSKSLKISNTGLQIINAHTFQAWSFILEELIISNNSNLEIFPLDIVDGVLMKLNKLDLSDNSIKTLDANYNWFTYSYATQLLLKNQQLDLFLKSRILQALPQLHTIDFSRAFITENNDDLIKNYFPTLSNLVSIDVSYTNLTEKMIIDMLTSISQTENRFIDICLLGHTLTDNNFCSYYQIFKNAPSLLNLQLDHVHECNCIIDLFYMDQLEQGTMNTTTVQPACLFNITRARCNIQTQLSISKCNIGGQYPSHTTDTDENTGNYAFGGVVAGLSVIVVILISLGFSVVYRVRKRRSTDLFMEHPVENPLAAIIEERLQNA